MCGRAHIKGHVFVLIEAFAIMFHFSADIFLYLFQDFEIINLSVK